MHFNDRESIIALIPLWKGERLPDGRPKVEDKYLDNPNIPGYFEPTDEWDKEFSNDRIWS